jgi:hypothetical protein
MIRSVKLICDVQMVVKQAVVNFLLSLQRLAHATQSDHLGHHVLIDTDL